MKTPSVVFFQLALVLKQSIDDTDSVHKPNVAYIIETHARKWGASAKDVKTIQQLLDKRSKSLLLSTIPPEATLKKTLHSIYEEMCQHLGPVKSDTLLDAAIKRVANTKAARGFHPSNFL